MEDPKISKSAKRRARQKQKKIEERETSLNQSITLKKETRPTTESKISISEEINESPPEGQKGLEEEARKNTVLDPQTEKSTLNTELLPRKNPVICQLSTSCENLQAAFSLLRSTLHKISQIEQPLLATNTASIILPREAQKMEDKKPEVTKSKEEILKERKEKKAEKAAKKQKDEAVPKKVEGAPPKEDSGKSKAELRAERRAKQEAQRAAKSAQNVENVKPAATATTTKAVQPAKRVPDQIQADRPSVEKKLARRLASQQVPQLPPAQRKVQLFSHLQQQERKLGINQLTKDLGVNQDRIHPAIISLGLQYASGVVSGSNARAIALLIALKQVIVDYSTPEDKELSRDLETRLKPCISFLEGCRPKSVSMGNAIRYVKRNITNIPGQMNDVQAKQHLHDTIDRYIEEIELAGKAISEEAGKKIETNDVIMTYGFSSLVGRILLEAHSAGKKFRVIVLDGRPHCDGMELLRRLAAARIPASYMLISAAPYIMPEVTKVFLGAHALLANGNVMSRIGASQVALVAKAHNVPVLVCCETYKFCERVQTDSFVFNELGDPDDLASVRRDGSRPSSSIANWRQMEKLFLLNLKYDVTPADLVTAVITELAVLPCTSVPVVLRVKNAENLS